MGVYVYSLRKKKVPIHVNGEKVMASLFDFSYKVSYSMWDSEDKGYLFRARNTDRNAHKAFEAYDGGYVIVGQHDQAAVYKNLTSPIWYDTDDFPADHIGNVEKFAHWLILGAEDPALTT